MKMRYLITTIVALALLTVLPASAYASVHVSSFHISPIHVSPVHVAEPVHVSEPVVHVAEPARVSEPVEEPHVVEPAEEHVSDVVAPIAPELPAAERIAQQEEIVSHPVFIWYYPWTWFYLWKNNDVLTNKTNSTIGLNISTTFTSNGTVTI